MHKIAMSDCLGAVILARKSDDFMPGRALPSFLRNPTSTHRRFELASGWWHSKKRF
jgi:hypothetical protein